MIRKICTRMIAVLAMAFSMSASFAAPEFSVSMLYGEWEGAQGIWRFEEDGTGWLMGKEDDNGFFQEREFSWSLGETLIKITVGDTTETYEVRMPSEEVLILKANTANFSVILQRFAESPP